MKPLLSIIVPVYNSERYLSELLESVLNNSFKDYELILVDDCSTDSSLEICRNYAHKDSRIVITQTKLNYGASTARNTGIYASRGGWITFIDSDDVITYNYLKNLVEVTFQYKELDFVQAGCTNYIDGKICNVEQFYERYIGDNKDKLINTFRGLTVAKLFKKEIIEKYDIKFDENIRAQEDYIFTLEYVSHVKQYAYLSETGYLYRRDNPHSITHTSFVYGYAKSLYYYKRHYETLSKINGTFPIRQKRLANDLSWVIFSLYKECKNKNERISILQSIFRKEEFDCLKFVDGKKNKILFWLLRHNIYLADIILSRIV